MEKKKDPLSCIFCVRGFARSDALKRHWVTCKTRQECGLAIPNVPCKTRGRKLRACDQCCIQKRACTFTEPCKSCTSRGQKCTYSRHKSISSVRSPEPEVKTPYSPSVTPFDLTLYESAFDTLAQTQEIDLPSPSEQSFSLVSWKSTSDQECMRGEVPWLIFDEYTLAAALYRRPTDLNVEFLVDFPFLSKFTQFAGFVVSFECGSVEKRKHLTAEPTSLIPIDPTLSTDLLITEVESNELNTFNLGSIVLHNTANLAPALLPLLSQTQKIVSQIRHIAISSLHKRVLHRPWSSDLQAQCYAFFHPSHIQKYLSLFWSCWNPNWPVIHRPTFATAQRSPCLIAALMIMGACLSPDDEDHVAAQTWLNAVEEMVFADDVFAQQEPGLVWSESEGTPDRRSLKERQRQLDVMQAAYGVCLYQTWEGSKQSKKRVLRHRYSEIIFLARDIGWHHATLKTVDTSSLQAFNWEEFILRESLIRTFTYIHNLDSGFATFFRRPPTLSLSETSIDLTTPESCFQASSPASCLPLLRDWRSVCSSTCSSTSTSTSTLPTAVGALTMLRVLESLYTTPPHAEHSLTPVFAQMSVLNMFTLISAIYSQTFVLETALSSLSSPFPSSFTTTSTSPVTAHLSAALSHWAHLWPSPTRDAELARLGNGVGLDAAMARDYWRRVGFVRHAPEYWLLTRCVVDRLGRGGDIGGRLGGSGDGNGNENRSSDGDATWDTQGALVKREEGDMGAFQALIREFRRLGGLGF
ncbi:hypothetical protein IQ07DRAFT_376207 [Pyrenochaeta sp. DS3sAY3a]|nr:hypothetical protein IQ07DRAFT_376207 [Pyrenochaeta sp. DS3sAY3a]